MLCRRTVRVKVEDKAIPTSFLKIGGVRTLVGMEEWRKRNSEKNGEVFRIQVLKLFPGVGESKERRSEKDAW